MGYWVSDKPSSTSCCEMTPSRSSPAFLLFRFLSRAFSRLPPSLQSELQYFSLNQPRNLRLQTRHVFRTLWSVFSSGSSLPFGFVGSSYYLCTGIKSKCTDTARTGLSGACLCLASPLLRLIVRAKAKPDGSGL